MKGEFRNGRYVDDNPQEYRHIHYDLDPEKMEKIWVIKIVIELPSKVETSDVFRFYIRH